MTTSARVRTYLASCDLRSDGNIHACGRSLAMSASVISRRLHSEGVKFSALLDAERRCRCSALYSRHKRPDAALVMMVTGYGGESSVTRAMRRWYQMSLIDMRG